ncbi:hypothetical protein Hdeb2414_s0001g00001131 [Helianthus debilis subsp. tardiflorus]
MKVKNGSRPVGTPKVGTELVLKIFRFGKFGTGTQNNLLIYDHGFHTNNIVTIQLFWFIFFQLSFSVFFLHFLFILVSSSVRNTLVVIQNTCKYRLNNKKIRRNAASLFKPSYTYYYKVLMNSNYNF